MKKEREIAELIFDIFRKTNCKTNQGFMPRNLIQVVKTLNPKEKECFDTVYVGLQALRYISVDTDGGFIRLTEKGYNYIYDDEVVNKIKSLPWVIPAYSNTDWNAAYNRLWKIIGPQNEASFYIGGPDYLKHICRLDDSICVSYSKYIEDRTKKELSTSRVDYYKDLLMCLNKEKRYEFFVNIQAAIEDRLQVIVADDADDLNPLPFDDVNIATTENADSTAKEQTLSEEVRPKVFISYSWDSEEHQTWVLRLAETLVEKWGIDVILDKWDLHGGKLMPHFMESSVNSAKRVICVITPNYCKKADGLQGGVGAEYSIITTKYMKDLLTDKFIPLLREGDNLPTYLDGRFRYEIKEEKNFDKVVEEIARDVFGKPKHIKPQLGNVPNFD